LLFDGQDAVEVARDRHQSRWNSDVRPSTTAKRQGTVRQESRKGAPAPPPAIKRHQDEEGERPPPAERPVERREGLANELDSGVNQPCSHPENESRKREQHGERGQGRPARSHDFSSRRRDDGEQAGKQKPVELSTRRKRGERRHHQDSAQTPPAATIR
jgi:hypothetical protein